MVGGDQGMIDCTALPPERAIQIYGAADLV